MRTSHDAPDAPETAAAAPGPGSVFAPELRAATIAIMTMVALSAFEGLAVAAALPQVAADLGGVSLLPWVVTTYLLVAGVSTVVSGALVDRVGAAPTFRVSAVLFIAGSVVCAVAPSMEVLVAARVLQGIGGGAVNAVALAAVGLVFPPRLVGRAFAVNATVWGVMSVAGPALAAGLLTVASWHWIFLVNVPLGGTALVLGWRSLPRAPVDPDAPRGRIDPLAVLLLTVFSVGMLVAVDRLSWWSLPAAAVAALAGWAVLRRSRGRDDALIAPRHVVATPFGPLAWTIMLLLVGGIATQSYVPLYLSAGRGAGTALTAWSVLFFTLGWTTGAQVSSRLMDATGPLRVTRVGATLVAPACAAVAAAAWLSAPLPVVFGLLVVAGFGMGTSTNSALTLLRELAVDGEFGRASAAHQYVRSQGFAGGAAVGGAVLLFVVAGATGDVEAVRGLLAEGAEVAVAPAVSRAVEQGFATACAVGAGVALFAHLPLRVLRRAVRDRRAEELEEAVPTA